MALSANLLLVGCGGEGPTTGAGTQTPSATGSAPPQDVTPEADASATASPSRSSEDLGRLVPLDGAVPGITYVGPTAFGPTPLRGLEVFADCPALDTLLEVAAEQAVLRGYFSESTSDGLLRVLPDVDDGVEAVRVAGEGCGTTRDGAQVLGLELGVPGADDAAALAAFSNGKTRALAVVEREGVLGVLTAEYDGLGLGEEVPRLLAEVVRLVDDPPPAPPAAVVVPGAPSEVALARVAAAAADAELELLDLGPFVQEELSPLTGALVRGCPAFGELLRLESAYEGVPSARRADLGVRQSEFATPSVDVVVLVGHDPEGGPALVRAVQEVGTCDGDEVPLDGPDVVFESVALGPPGAEDSAAARVRLIQPADVVGVRDVVLELAAATVGDGFVVAALAESWQGVYPDRRVSENGDLLEPVSRVTGALDAER